MGFSRRKRLRRCFLFVLAHSVRGQQQRFGLGLVFSLKVLEGFRSVVEGVIDALAAEEQAIALFHFRSASRFSLNGSLQLNHCGKSTHKAAHSEESSNCCRPKDRTCLVSSSV